ncbi:MAG: hypothetical protein LBT91_02745 [Bifidobacteriaceae bacterium]|jgi:hypothetical protein|nr:hypothetical protein [Bifidobacteriaceae bacterium]
MTKFYKNKMNGKIVEFADNTPVSSIYEPYNNKPCSNCATDTKEIKDFKSKKIETQFDEVEEEAITKKKGKK